MRFGQIITSLAQLLTRDHDLLQGLGDDDHAQYLDIVRHDVLARHPIGTVVPHDKFMSLNGLWLKRKPADETVNNSSVLQNDDDLFYPIEVGIETAFLICLFWIGQSSADMKVAITTPAGALLKWGPGNAKYNAAGVLVCGEYVDTSGTATDFGSVGGAGKQILLLSGGVICAAVAGTVQLQWAQNTAEASDLIVKRQSFLIAWKLV